MGAYKKGFWLKLGPIAAIVDVNSVIPSQRPTGLKRLCPDHHTPLKQAYKCDEGHDVAWGAWVQGKAVGNEWAIVEDAPSFSADDTIELAVIKADEVDASTFMEGSIYYLESDKNTVEGWELLRRFASDPKLALIGKAAFRRGPTRKMWRLTTFRGFLVLRELKFPEEIRETPEAPTVKLSKELTAIAKQWVEANTATWDKFDASNEALAQFEALLDAAPKVEFKGGIIPKGESAGPAPVLDMLAGIKADMAKKKAS